jgi:multiple antibiotic resistance protein
MGDLVHRFLQCFIPLFVAIDAVGLAAIFMAMARGVDPDRRARIAKQATWTAGGVALLFLLLGQSIFSALGISVGDFQVAGGLILFILASRELLQTGPELAARLGDDFGVVPLGMPLIAGPATITTLLLLSQTQGFWMTLVALVANLVLVIAAFNSSEWLVRKIGTTGLRAVSKIIALLLAAIAVHMIHRGWNSP